MADQHRGRLTVEYTDDGTCYRDKTTGLYVHVMKMYGYEAYVAKIREHATRSLVPTKRPKAEVSGRKRFAPRPTRRQLTEWLDEVLAATKKGGE